MHANAPLHHSPWLDTPFPETGPLLKDVSCDVCIVGGGMAGLLIAERLLAERLSVVVLESGALARGETCQTTAHFTSVLDARATRMSLLHGAEGARLAAQSHASAIDYVESLIARLAIDCGWSRRDGYLVVNDRHLEKRGDLLDEELAACHAAGLTAHRVQQLPTPWPAELGAALRFPAQAEVHPLKLLSGVARSILARGARVHTGTRATNIKGGGDAAVETQDGAIVRCGHVVVATNTPINNLIAVHTKQAGYQTYAQAFLVPAGVLPPILLWDGLWEDDEMYRYVRLATGCAAFGGDDVLIVGGEDHKTGQGPDGEEPFRRLEEWTRRTFPLCGTLVRKWSGEVMEPVDGLAYIGHNAVDRKNVYIVTGDCGSGMTHAGIAAMLIPDLILVRDNPWASLYSPARKVGFHAMEDYAQENANTLAQYRDWLSRGDVASEAEIPPGHGAVLVNGMRRLAVYKDEQGACTRMHASCPHLGGVVRWNSQERTWDCPCHASRFDRRGKVMHGPANSDLKPIAGG